MYSVHSPKKTKNDRAPVHGGLTWCDPMCRSKWGGEWEVLVPASIVNAEPRRGVRSSAIRVACVQGGDYWTTKCRLDADGTELYGGQKYSVEAYERFVRGHAHLIVSIDAPAYDVQRGEAWYRGAPRPLNTRLVPRRVSEWLRARQIIRALEEFGITHLIVRCNDLVGCELLKWSIARKVPTAGILASRFAPEHRWSKRFCELGNAPNVLLLANHNRVATASMVDCGLQPDKAVAWDFPPAVHPDDWSPKQLPSGACLQILFAGRVCTDKGVTDLLAACELARAQGLQLQLTICGDGPSLAEVRRHPGVTAGWVECVGQLQNKQVHERMRSSTLVIVPSRHSFAEGLPLVIYESLAMRTPLILNDHPIFVRYFRDDVGVRFFHNSDPADLCRQIVALARDPAAYGRLSQESKAAWESLTCPNRFEDVLTRLHEAWGMAGPHGPTSA